jgi:hypothetical protein
LVLHVAPGPPQTVAPERLLQRSVPEPTQTALVLQEPPTATLAAPAHVPLLQTPLEHTVPVVHSAPLARLVPQRPPAEQPPLTHCAAAEQAAPLDPQMLSGPQKLFVQTGTVPRQMSPRSPEAA